MTPEERLILHRGFQLIRLGARIGHTNAQLDDIEAKMFQLIELLLIHARLEGLRTTASPTRM